MYISKFQVVNYKSYLESGQIELRPGFNAIIGQNSVGKTALLNALSFQFEPNPHRSEKTVPVQGTQLSDTSSVDVTFEISGKELLEVVRIVGLGQIIPEPLRGPMFGKIEYDGTMNSMNRVLTALSHEPQLTFSARFNNSGGNRNFSFDPSVFLGYRISAQPDGTQPGYTVRITANGDALETTQSVVRSSSDLRTALAYQLLGRVYRFRAERYNLGESAVGINSRLAPDANNLAEVLNIMQSNPAPFEEYNLLVRIVLPTVQHVSVRPLNNNRVQILIWPHKVSSRREDLAIPLTECGSGVGQVLAILYAITASKFPQVLLIDEPQSFLHPGAVRKLIEVLKQYPRHQYVLATHSPTVISAAEPATITVVRSSGFETQLEVIDPTNTKEFGIFLSEVGARLSDVFGADNVLWVEGQTEEIGFPVILQKLKNRSLMGTAIVGIQQVGDLQQRDRKRVLEIYRRLAGANSLMPPALAFVFDSECLTQQQKKELESMLPGSVHFLPRRMYENYLLDPDAVAATVNAIEGFSHNPIQAAEVTALFAKKRPETKSAVQLRYFCDRTTAVPTDWELAIDAAKLLSDAFNELSETRVSYEKTKHSVAITKWLLENKPEALKELADFVDKLLPRD